MIRLLTGAGSYAADMETRGSVSARPVGSVASLSRRWIGDRRGLWLSRGKQAVAALVLVNAAYFTGSASPAAASATPVQVDTTVTASEAASPGDLERALGARLATEYTGAVPAGDVESLVRGVGRQLRREASPPERLLHTTEAVCRRALTDFLARGVPLPAT